MMYLFLRTRAKDTVYSRSMIITSEIKVLIYVVIGCLFVVFLGVSLGITPCQDKKIPESVTKQLQVGDTLIYKGDTFEIHKK